MEKVLACTNYNFDLLVVLLAKAIHLLVVTTATTLTSELNLC